MDNYIWIFPKNDDRNLWWAFACSLALHFVLLAILVIKPLYPISGISEKLDSIWLYTSLTVQGDSTAKASATPGSGEPVPIEREKLAEKVSTVQSPVENKPNVVTKNEVPRENEITREEPIPEPDGQAEPVTEMLTAKVIEKKVEKAVEKDSADKKPALTKPAEKLMDDDAGVNVNQRKTPANAANAAKDVEKKAESAKTEQVAREAVAVKMAAKAHDGKALPGPIQSAVTSARRQLTQSARKDPGSGSLQTLKRNSTGLQATGQAAGKPENRASSDKKVEGNPFMPTFVAMGSPFMTNNGKPGKSSAQAGVRPGSEPSAPQGAGKPGGKEGQGKAPSAAAQPKSNAVNPPGQPRNVMPPGDSKIALLPLFGDLKLEIAGKSVPIISISFKEYLKSHRHRPMTRAEARRVQIVKPVTRTVGEVVEAVVGTTGEGVYEFIVAPGNGNPVTAVFTLKIYENRGNAKTRSLGTKTLKGKTTVARILMPEGIFWDDENNFSGYLEDSDSITKYNSDNGLVWKEYKSPED